MRIAPVLRKDIWNCNLHARDVQNIVKQDSFWKMLLTVWAEVHFVTPKNIKEVKQQSWYNSEWKAGSKITTPIGRLVNKGVMTVADLLNENGKVMSFASFCKKT